MDGSIRGDKSLPFGPKPDPGIEPIGGVNDDGDVEEYGGGCPRIC